MDCRAWRSDRFSSRLRWCINFWSSDLDIVQWYQGISTICLDCAGFYLKFSFHQDLLPFLHLLYFAVSVFMLSGPVHLQWWPLRDNEIQMWWNTSMWGWLWWKGNTSISKPAIKFNKFHVHQCQAEIEIWHSPDAHLTTWLSSDLPLTLTRPLWTDRIWQPTDFALHGLDTPSVIASS